MRFVVLAHVSVAAAFLAIAACEDDATVEPGPLPDASSDATAPTDAPADSSTPIDAGTPADWTKITWEILPSLPLDGVRAGSECDVAVDANDHVLVTYGEAADGYAAPRSLGVFRHDGTAWSLLGGTPLVPDSGSISGWPRLAVSKDGTVFIAYNHQGPRVARFAANTWTELPAPPFTSVWGIAVDSANMPSVIGDNTDVARQLSRFDGASWGAPTAPLTSFDASGTFLLNGVLAVAPRGDGLVALVRAGSPKLAPYTFTNNSWAPLGAEIADNAEFPEISAQGNGHLSASWSAGNNVFAARFDPATQSFVSLGGAIGGPDSRYAVTAIDAFNRPFVAWRQPTDPLEVSIFVDGAWQALPNPGVVRSTLPAIAIDRNGLPVLCFEAGRDAGIASQIFVARGVIK